MARILDAILGFQRADTPLISGPDIWYEVFMWTFFSSIFVYVLAAGCSFFTLRKHKFGRFYPLMILMMGVVFIPLTYGVMSSAAIAFVYKTSSFGMGDTHAMMWGVGQTLVHASFGYFRFLATL